MLMTPGRDAPQPKGLPSSEESERAVLAGVLLSNGERIAELDLRAEDFYLERHQLIWTAMQFLAGAGQPVDLRTLQAQLESVGAFEPVGGFAYLAGLDLDLPDLSRINYYAGIVRERATRRQLVMEMSDLCSGILGGELTADAALAKASGAISSIQVNAAGMQGPRTMADVIDDLDVWTPLQSGLLGITSGLYDLDLMTLGWERGCQYVVGARPGMGKSSLAATFAVGAARAGARVLVFSLEMPEEQWAQRILAQESGAGGHSGIALRRIRLRQIGGSGSPARAHMLATMNSVAQLPISIVDQRGLTASKIHAIAAAHKLKHGLDLIIVDHLGLVRYQGDARTKTDKVGETSQALREMLDPLDVPGILLCQLNRETLKTAGQRPALENLRDSGNIEEHADGVIFIHREAYFMRPDHPEYEAKKGIAELIAAKLRQGETGFREVAWIGELTGFRDLAHQSEQMAAQAAGGGGDIPF